MKKASEQPFDPALNVEPIGIEYAHAKRTVAVIAGGAHPEVAIASQLARYRAWLRKHWLRELADRRVK